MVLTGRHQGTARIGTEGGRTAVRLSAGALPDGYTVYLLENGALLPLSDTAVRTLRPEALLISDGRGRILCTGGFAGRDAARMRAERDVRIREQTAPIMALPVRADAYARPMAAQGVIETSSSKPPLKPPEAMVPAVPARPVRQNSEPCPDGSRPDGSRPDGSRPEDQRAEPVSRRVDHVPPGGPRPEGSRPEGPEARSEALLNILRTAQALFGPLAGTSAAAEKAAEEAAEEAANVLFPKAYPGLTWKRVRYPGSRRCYLEARLTDAAGGHWSLHAMPGEYAPRPPAPGFTQFLRTADGRGWWVRKRRAET